MPRIYEFENKILEILRKIRLIYFSEIDTQMQISCKQRINNFIHMPYLNCKNVQA